MGEIEETECNAAITALYLEENVSSTRNDLGV